MRVTKPAVAVAPTQKLHKVLAQAGLGSRREMEEWILAGKVTVNGLVAHVGTRVGSDDRVQIGRRVVHVTATPSLPRVLLYHKPEGEITSRDDPQGRATVFDRLPPLHGAKWVAIGRLDYNTGGLLVFTTSGELANHMMHPRFEIEREYAVRIIGQLSDQQVGRLLNGVLLSDGSAKFARVESEGGDGTNRWYRIVCKEGRNRIVRRMFEAVGLKVSRLMRVRFGNIKLPPRLRRGQTLELSAGETGRLLAWLDALPVVPPTTSRGVRG
jgi:23S rRNA pseudouridine2605 synthase